MEPLTPEHYGLPPKRDSYSAEEKALIVAKAAEVGVHPIAEAYGFAWQTIVSWKRYYEPIIIQSPSGQEITPKEIKEKVGLVEKIYVRADEGKAYLIKG
ncbi:MAG: hypothetical protein IJQ24_06900 [Synergistaceae bacterium]|nr:hypothetical protein [Synergistaceae bacterium]